jgi:hypothetical protein
VQVASKPCFHQLRTTERLGYSVACTWGDMQVGGAGGGAADVLLTLSSPCLPVRRQCMQPCAIGPLHSLVQRYLRSQPQ